VLGYSGHGKRVQRLDHERADGRQRKAAVAMHSPDQASRPEQACISGAVRNRASVGSRQRSHHLESRLAVYLEAHGVTIPEVREKKMALTNRLSGFGTGLATDSETDERVPQGHR
jgi:hypothetical protein